MDVFVVPHFAESDFILKYRADTKRAADEGQRRRVKKRQADKRKREALVEAGVVEHWIDRKEREQFLAINAYERDLDIHRIECGYVRVGGGRKISGIKLAERVFEKGLRSRTFVGNQFMELFPSYLPKRGLIRANWGKSVLHTLKSKVVALDLPYVEGRRDCLGFIRWDTDFVWSSVDDCKTAFLKLRESGVPIPHVLTGLLLPTGEYVRPHALRGLPYGQGVMANPTAQGFRPGPLKLYTDVYYGMCEAMLELGCDPGAPATSMQTKNPLSPELHTIVLQDDDWRSLKEMASSLKRGLRRDKLVRQAAAVQSGMSIEASNEIFETYRRAALECLRSWLWSGDPAYTKAMASPDRKDMLLHVQTHLSSISVSSEIDQDLSKIQAKVAQYAIDHWDPTKVVSKRKNEGALAHVVVGMSTKASQAEGGRYSARMKKDAALEKIKRALEAFVAAGEKPPSVRKLAKAAGVSPDTVQSRKNEVAELVAALWPNAVRNRSNVKKDRLTR